MLLISYAYPSGDKGLNDVEITRIFFCCSQFVCWSVSIYLLRFELMRRLGHVWYVHYLFVWLSVAVYLFDFIYTVMGEYTGENTAVNLIQTIGIICLVILSTFTGVLVICYPKDIPYGGRNYINDI